MKYYSETLRKVFDTEEELKKEEELNKECSSADDLETSTSELCDEQKGGGKEKSVTKKDLAHQIEVCDEKVREKRHLYDVARKKAEEISKKYLDEIDSILTPAKDAVKKAEKEKFEAVKRFNDSYGVYRVSYGGARAAEEFSRAMDQFLGHEWFGDLFKLF